jgi:drug/metabolite transporter (DMT)-like permease
VPSLWLAYGVLVLCTLFWSGSGLVGRAASGNVPPMALSFWRWVGAFAVLLPFAFAGLRRNWPVVARHWPRMILFALLGVVGFTIPYYVGLQFTVAINAALLNGAGPAMILVCSLVIVGTPVTRRQAAGIALAAFGMLIIITRGSVAALAGLRLNLGDFLVLLSHLSWSVYTVVLRWAPKELDPLTFLAIIVAIAIAMIAPFYGWELAQGRGFDATPANLSLIVYAAVFPSAIAFLLWGKAVPVVGANTAGAFQYLVPVFGVAGAVALLGESFHMFHLAGIAAIFAGVYLATPARQR